MAPAFVVAMAGAAGGGRQADTLKRVVTAVVAIALSQGVAAADYPSRPVRLIVPQPPGGGTDYVARLLVPRLGESLGRHQPKPYRLAGFDQ